MDLRQELKECLKGRVCLLGVGNSVYGDDALGIQLAAQLSKRFEECSTQPDVIEAGMMPERYVGRIIDDNQYDSVVFLDAVDFEGEAGSVLVANSEEMVSRFPQISTHKISLGMLATWVESSGTTKAWLIGIQPGLMKMGQGITQAVQDTIDVLVEVIYDLWCE